MGNLCSIHHAKHDRLKLIAGSPAKAELLSKCLFWWQISTYTLNDHQIWFTRPYEQIAEELGVSLRTVNRYLKEFVEEGLIERRNKLSASNKTNFKVIKRTYIRITEKLLSKIQKPQDVATLENCAPSSNNQQNTALKRTSFNQFGTIENANLALSIYYKEKDHNLNNSTVSNIGIVNNLKTTPHSSTPKPNPSSAPTYPIESQIGERITERLKNYIKGMLKNVRKQYDLKISDPDKLFAEVVFSVTQDLQWQGIDHPHHRVNIIAKMLRQKTWRTPKGFYNHWDIGALYRKKDVLRFEKSQKEKINECKFSNNFWSKDAKEGGDAQTRFEHRTQDEYRYSKTKAYEKDIELQKLDTKLVDLNLNIRSQESYLRELEGWLKQDNPCVSQTLINAVAIKVASLYEKKQELLSQIKSMTDRAA